MPALISGIAAIVFGAVVAVTGLPAFERLTSLPESHHEARSQGRVSETNAAQRSAAATSAGDARFKTDCAGCDVNETTRVVTPLGNSHAVFEHAEDPGNGFTRVLNDASPANSRTSESTFLLDLQNRSGKWNLPRR